MKKLFTLFVIMFALIYTKMNAQFISPGDKSTYTFTSLSSNAETGINKTGNIFQVTKDITISATDTLRIENDIIVQLGDGILIRIEGYGDFAPSDTATITRIDKSNNPKGIFFYDNNAQTILKNITFEYGGVKYGGKAGINIENCTFQYINTKLSSSAALSFSGVSGGNSITNCKFISNEASAIASGANIPCGILFKNNYLFDNTTTNANRPQINLTVPGDETIEITGNTIIGAKRTKVGGISVSNMLTIAGKNKVIIESNYITNCRYGITTLGAMNAIIRKNTLIDNKYETNPMAGGSGISISDLKEGQTTMITENIIQGHLWGITILGGKDINIGKTDDPNASDYNPGLNVFKDNGNNNVLYDLYNNTGNTIYAQGNTWNVAIQDSINIENVIFHKNDDSELGEVIFMSHGTTGIETTLSNDEIYFDSSLKAFVSKDLITNISIYSIKGDIIYENKNASSVIYLPELSKGIYLAKITNRGKVLNIKFIF